MRWSRRSPVRCGCPLTCCTAPPQTRRPAGVDMLLDAIDDDPDVTAAQRRSLTEVDQAFRQVTIRRRRTRGRGTA